MAAFFKIFNMSWRKKFLGTTGVVAVVLGLIFGGRVWADTPALPQLVISQFKITSSNGQFVTLYNQTNSTLNLDQFELDYISSSGKLSSIPVSGQLAPQSYFMLSDDKTQLCYQMTVDSVSLGFSTTGGSFQVWQVTGNGATKTLEDSVSWTSKSGSTNPQSLPSQNADNTVSLLRQPVDSSGNPQVATPGDGSWLAVQPGAAACSLETVVSDSIPTPIANPGNQLLPSLAPPVTIIPAAASASGGPSLPAGDAGLMAPVLNELLPNPAAPQTDAADEFIELYNPNAGSFDLSGFMLQTASTTSTTNHTYTFPAGTSLPGQSFVAFYSVQTGLSLSNSGGQVWLLDPFGNTIGQTDPYGTAKDGQTWALANGSWSWSTTATPNAANVINAPSSSKSSSSKATTASSKTAGTASSATSTAAGSTTLSSSNSANTADQTTPIHPAVLAVVAGLALVYGLYEYRTDLANRVHQFRRYRETRRAAGGKP